MVFLLCPAVLECIDSHMSRASAMRLHGTCREMRTRACSLDSSIDAVRKISSSPPPPPPCAVAMVSRWAWTKRVALDASSISLCDAIGGIGACADIIASARHVVITPDAVAGGLGARMAACVVARNVDTLVLRSAFPRGLETFTSMRLMDVQCEIVTTLPAAVSGMISLLELRLRCPNMLLFPRAMPPALRILCLSDMAVVTMPVMTSVRHFRVHECVLHEPPRMPNLVSLSLNFFSTMGGDGDDKCGFFSGCGFVRVVEVCGVPSFGCAHLSPLTRMVSLRVWDCMSFLLDDGIINKLQCLKHMDVSGCMSVRSMPRSLPRTLEFLSITRCRNMLAWLSIQFEGELVYANYEGCPMLDCVPLLARHVHLGPVCFGDPWRGLMWMMIRESDDPEVRADVLRHTGAFATSDPFVDVRRDCGGVTDGE